MGIRGAVVGALVCLLLAACGTQRGALPAPPTPPAASTSVSQPTPTPRPTPSSLVPSSLASILAAGPVPTEGADVSWPNCPKGMGIPQKRSKGLPMPLPSAGYVFVGLTNGPGFVANPCLAAQVAWVREHHLYAAAYAVVSTPRDDELQTYGGREKVGEAQARFNVASMRKAGLDTPAVWVDVEPVTGFDWPADTAANAQVVEGAIKGYESAGYRVGLYSIGSLWRRVVGDLRLGLPEWRPAGGTSRAEALERCGAGWSFQGGAPVFVQWVDGVRDRDVTCPGADSSLWFHRY